MLPSNFEESNSVLGPPTGYDEDEIHSLVCWRGAYGADGPACVISHWKPTVDEIEALKRGDGLWLYCLGKSMPPVILTTDNPFEDTE